MDSKEDPAKALNIIGLSVSLNHPAHIMPNEVDEFLKGLDEVPEDPFKPEADPLAPEVKEEVVPEVKKEEEKPVPFHKDPKVTRFIEKAVEKRVSQIKPSETTQFIKETTGDDIDDVLTRIIGNDTPEKLSAIKDFKKVLLEREEKGAQKALDQIESKRREEEAEERRAQEELTQGFENIEETFGVDLTSNTASAKKDRTDFVEFITRIAPKNSEGQVIAFPDLEASYETFQERKKANTQPNTKAKELASRGMSRSADASTVPQNTDKSWAAVERIFSKLTK